MAPGTLPSVLPALGGAQVVARQFCSAYPKAQLGLARRSSSEQLASLTSHSRSGAVEMDKKNDAYVFVLDEQGEIIFKDSRRYSESKLEKIADLVEL